MTNLTRNVIANYEISEKKLVGLGCPCNILSIFPQGGNPIGGYNLSIRIENLNLYNHNPENLTLLCSFGGKINTSAQVQSNDEIVCAVPSQDLIGNFESVSVGVIVGQVLFEQSPMQANMFQYSLDPFVNFTTPAYFVADTSPESARTITLKGQNFKSDLGGLELRSAYFDVFAVVLSQEVAIAVLPMVTINPQPLVTLKFEISINRAQFQEAGLLSAFQWPSILGISPCSGAVSGGSIVRIAVTSIPARDMDRRLFKIWFGQYSADILDVNETYLLVKTPMHTVALDPTWRIPGEARVEVVYQATPFNNETSFVYNCSDHEIASNVCCPPGYFGNGLCFMCLEGKFAPAVGSSTCFQCPAASDSQNSSSHCTCNAGYFGLIDTPGQVCEECPAGTFRSGNMTACTSCEMGKWSPPGSASCAINMSQPCLQGYLFGPDAEACCEQGYFWVTEIASCLPCPPGTHASPDSHSASLELCTLCEPGKYTNGSGSMNCTSCPSSSFSAAGQSYCVACPQGSRSPAESSSPSDCVCDVGLVRRTSPEVIECLLLSSM
eukprot:597361-Hanusia_phi.AAC.1